MNVSLSVTLLLIASAARVGTEPTLMATPNPIGVPAGQLQGKTILTWNTEGPDGYVWVSVDGGDDTQLSDVGAAEGRLEATVEFGKGYAFKLYTADRERMLVSVMVTAVAQQAAAPPAAQTPSNAGPGALKSKARFPFFSNVQAVPRASFVDISYSTIQPAGTVIEVSTQRPLAAVADLPDVIPAGQKVPPAFPPDVALTTFAISSDPVKQRTGHLRDLQPNTTYYYVITTSAPDGRTHRYWDKFTTINRVVKVVFEKVLISQNAFVGGPNAWSFSFAADDSWLSDADGWLRSSPGSGNSVLLGNNQWADLNVEARIQPAPGSLPLSVFALAKAPFPGDYGVTKTKEDPRPQGQNTGSTRNTAWATARDGIDLTANSTDQPGTYPFKLAATGSGSLMMFEVLGRVEVSYPGGVGSAENIGTTSSPLTVAPAPIKAGARVRVGSNDFNADGRGDLLWHNAATRESQVWFLSGTSRIGRATISDGARPALIGPPWHIVGSRDFNGDGKADLLWHNSSTGETQIWHMNGATLSSRATLLGENGSAAFVGLPWSIVGSGDFNADGKPDVLWYNGTSGETQIWRMNGYRVIGRATLLGENGRAAFVGLPWRIAGSGDFNADGKPDVLWHNGATGETQIWYLNGDRLTGRATVLGGSGSAALVGLPWRIAGANDFNQDGAADILWHNVSTGETQMWLMNGRSVVRRVSVDAERDGGGALVGLPWSIMNH